MSITAPHRVTGAILGRRRYSTLPVATAPHPALRTTGAAARLMAAHLTPTVAMTAHAEPHRLTLPVTRARVTSTRYDAAAVPALGAGTYRLVHRGQLYAA